MVIEGTSERYKTFLETNNTYWGFGNDVLYQMCANNPGHIVEDVILGKIWLIGRSYAAAIERRKRADSYSGDDFYHYAVAPKMLSIGPKLDELIGKLKKNKERIIDHVPDILFTHKFLMDAFMEITGLEKRSLASKYLHFHCPDLFFIYDSRARSAINKYVKKPDKRFLESVKDCDPEYGDFVCRMIELQMYLQDKVGSLETPRNMDTFLLWNGE